MRNLVSGDGSNQSFRVYLEGDIFDGCIYFDDDAEADIDGEILDDFVKMCQDNPARLSAIQEAMPDGLLIEIMP